MRVFGWCPLHQGLVRTGGRQPPGCTLYLLARELRIQNCILMSVWQSSEEAVHFAVCVDRRRDGK